MLQMDFGGCVKTTCGYGGCMCGTLKGEGKERGRRWRDREREERVREHNRDRDTNGTLLRPPCSLY